MQTSVFQTRTRVFYCTYALYSADDCSELFKTKSSQCLGASENTGDQNEIIINKEPIQRGSERARRVQYSHTRVHLILPVIRRLVGIIYVI